MCIYYTKILEVIQTAECSIRSLGFFLPVSIILGLRAIECSTV